MSDRVRAAMVAVCLLALAALQIPLHTAGYRVSGDDVEALGYALEGPGAVWAWTLDVLEVQGRLGALTIQPLTAVGAVLSGNLAGRIAIAAGYLAVAALVAVWVARHWSAAAGGMLFLLLTVLQPLGLPHLPPASYPLVNTVPFAAILLALLLLDRTSTTATRVGISALLAMALAANEYALLFGAALIGGGWLAQIVRAEDAWPARLRALAGGPATRMEAASLTLAALAVIGWRLTHPSDYGGVSADGAGRPLAMLETALRHAAAGIGWPAVSGGAPAWRYSDLAMTAAAALLTGAATLLLLPRLSLPRAAGLVTAFYAIAAVLLVTLPVAAALRQQRWCLEGGHCAYLDSRSAAPFLCLLLVLALTALPKAKALRWIAAVAMGCAAAFVMQANLQLARAMDEMARPWQRAADLACAPDLWPSDPSRLQRMIDPWSAVRSHAHVDLAAVWRRVIETSADDCPSKGPLREEIAQRAAGLLPTLALPGHDLIGHRIPDGGYPARTGGRFLGEGWALVDGYGVWANGLRARLEIWPKLQRFARKPMLSLTFSRASEDSQPFRIGIGGDVLWRGDGRSPDGACCEARVPLPTPLPERLEVTLDFDADPSAQTHSAAEGAPRPSIHLWKISLRDEQP